MILLLFPFLLSPNANWIPTPQVIQNNQQAIEYASIVFEGTPLMDVAVCESEQRQWDENGNILQGIVVHTDIGFMQVNAKYHFEEAYALGYDIFKAEDNIKFARWLYDHQGLKPWSASSNCLKKRLAGGRSSALSKAASNPPE